MITPYDLVQGSVCRNKAELLEGSGITGKERRGIWK